MKKKISIALIAVLVVCAMTLAILSGCVQQHKCQDVCDKCGKCLTTCNDDACADKCLGHDTPSNHECNDQCPTCGKCLSDCDDDVCVEKCQGHNNNGDNGEDNDDGEGFTVTFVTDEHVTVYVYKTQDMSSGGEQTTTAYSRDSATGAKLDDGNGQVNFKLVFADGYEFGSIFVTDGYNNLKGSADTGVENGYRITKITANLVVTVTSQAQGMQEDLTLGYKVTFETDSHVTVIVYRTQDMSGDGEQTNVAYSRESGTGTLTKTDGQVNFKVICDEGYDAVIIISGGYKNLKDPSELGENIYRITKITSDLTVTITSTVKSTDAETYAEYDKALALGVNITCESGTENCFYVDGDVITFGTITQDTVYGISGTLNGSIVIDAGDDYKFDLSLQNFTVGSDSACPFVF